MNKWIVMAIALSCGGCVSVQGYDGPKRDRNEIARVSGDPSFSAGAPISVVLRQVDGRDLNVVQTSVEVLEGEHEFLVDCRIAETKSASRFAFKQEVFGGRHYRLRAETGPGLRSCSGVTLEAVD